jgi:hemerythrin
MNNSNNLIKWKDKYYLGNEKIDLEHKALFDIAEKANQVYEIDSEKKQKELLGQVVNDLYSYVDYHFNNEEEYLHEISFPNIEAHKELHTKLLDMLNFISLNLPFLSVKSAGNELYNFVQNIFVKHIIDDDMKITKYLKNK